MDFPNGRDTSYKGTKATASPERLPWCNMRLFVLLAVLLAGALFGWLPVPLASAAPVSQAGDNPVQVSLVEFEIRMPTELPAGSITFVVTNEGARQHNFEIEGGGIDQVFAQNLQPGEQNTLTVNLPPGEYRVYCPVGNHAGQGMELTLTVTEVQAAQAGSATTVMTSTQAVTSTATVTATAETTAPAVLPVTGSDPKRVAVRTLPVVAMVLLGLAAASWAIRCCPA